MHYAFTQNISRKFPNSKQERTTGKHENCHCKDFVMNKEKLLRATEHFWALNSTACHFLSSDQEQ
jgi:hypothetical protein